VSLAELRSRLEGRRGELSALRIVVLAGGGSSEREVSLRSGRAVAVALGGIGYNAELLQLAQDDLSIEARETTALPATVVTGGDSAVTALRTNLDPVTTSALSAIRQADVVFPMLHGSQGENGAWQGLLELAQIPYVSAGVKGSALAMDKIVTKRLFEQLGIPTPRWWVMRNCSLSADVTSDVHELVAKPPLEGSSVGIRMVANEAAGWLQARELNEQYDPLLLEERIYGRELTVGLIGPSAAAVALPIVEIKAGNDFYDYDAKYAGVSNYICPAELDRAIADQICAYALRVYAELDLGPFARIDCLLDKSDQAWFLEANTIPGFTEHSLLPMAARAAGIEMGELLELLMLCAIERHEAKRGAA
jgi:D-alanine-D-alanine ligase